MAVKVIKRKEREYYRKLKKKQEIPFHKLHKPRTKMFFWLVFILSVFLYNTFLEYINIIYFVGKMVLDL